MVYIDPFERAASEVVVLIGSGAVKDAWEPVYDALFDVRIPKRSADLANTYLATLVHRLRWLSGIVAFQQPNVHSEYRRLFDEARAEYRDTTRAIQRELEKNSAKLAMREEAPIIWNRFLRGLQSVGRCDFSIITTNWDFSVAHEFQDPSRGEIPAIDYLHGTFSVGLYLPGEVLDEPYRDSDNRSEFSASMISTVHLLRDASWILVYGLSFSPLDAELSFLIQSATSQRRRHLQGVVVVHPNFNAVIGRLRIHLVNVTFFGCEPQDVASVSLPEWWLHDTGY